jgi:WD40 repeat protein
MSTSIPASTLEKFTTFGDLLRFLRRRIDVTQTELSIAVGYSTAQISRLEQNLRLPDLPTIEARFVPALDLEDDPRAIARLLELAAKVRREDSPTSGLCPYKGLNYFDEADADWFVGREALTLKLTERVLSLASFNSSTGRRFLAVVGASGSGKSSLVRAGLVSSLRWNQRSADWQIYVLTPNAHPLESLMGSLNQAEDSSSTIATFVDDLAADTRSLHLFARRKLGSDKNSRLLLVVDQFEELFTLCHSEDERSAFIGNLLTAVAGSEGLVMVLITLRADFYAPCADYPELREALAQHQEYIGAMTRDELRRAIEEPARRGHWEIEPGLVDLLLHDVGQEPGALPLLSHALLETWQRRRGRTMTLSGYASSGGVRGAIAETAEAVFTDQFSGEQKAIARRIFLRLTELGGETATGDTRRRATFDELILRPEEATTTQTVLNALADARLITTHEGSAEVAHEALIREWPTLRNWLEENRESLRFHRQLTEAAQEWLASNREADLLYRSARLAQLREWSKTFADDMNLLEREFLAASLEQSEREIAERENQRQRELETAKELAETQRQSASRLRTRNRLITGVAGIAVILAMLAGLLGWRAENEKRLAISRELAIASVNNLDVDPQRSILLALQAVSVTYDVDGSVLPEAESALHQAIQASRVVQIIHAHKDMIFGLEISQDAKYIASGSDDGTAKIWDALSREELMTVNSNTGPVTYVALNADGTRLATAGFDGIARVWDANSGKELLTLKGHEGPIFGIAFNPDGTQVVTAGVDKTAIIWQAATGERLRTLRGHKDTVWKVSYSPDGTHIVTCSSDRSVRLWDGETGRELLTLTDFTRGVGMAIFSPDGRQILTSSDIEATLWDANTGAKLLTYTGHDRQIWGVAFSPDGKRAATTSEDGTAKVWDVSAGDTLVTLAGHPDIVTRVRFLQDGNHLVTSGTDKTLRIWDLSRKRGVEESTLQGHYAGWNTTLALSPDWTRIAANEPDGAIRIWSLDSNQESSRMRDGHKGHLWAVAFSPNGRKLITAGDNNLVYVWDTESGQKLLTLSGHGEGTMDQVIYGVMAAAFSPDETLIATAGMDKTARIWDAATGRQLLVLTGHTGGVLSIAFSPDSKNIATGSEDSTVRLWDTKTGVELSKLKGHTDYVWSLAYRSDGKRLASAGSGSLGGEVKVWDTTTGKELLSLSGHRGGVQSVAFSPDGKLLASSGYDATMRVWDMNSGKELLNLPGSWQVAFSPDGTRLATGGDNFVRIYLLRIEDLLALAKSRLLRSWTTEECQQYLHVEDCLSVP